MAHYVKYIIHTDGYFNPQAVSLHSVIWNFMGFQAIKLAWMHLRCTFDCFSTSLLFYPLNLDILPVRNTGASLPLLDKGSSSSLILSSIELARFILDENIHMLQNAARYTYQQHHTRDEAALVHLGNNDFIYAHIPLDQLGN